MAANTSTTRPRETIKILYHYELTNAPGKSIVAGEVYLPPGGWTPPHRHAGSTVCVHVLEGEFLSGMNGNPPQVYKPGDSFVERPGCHHTVGDNNSDTKPARVMAVFIVDTTVLQTEKGYAALTVLDPGYE